MRDESEMRQSRVNSHRQTQHGQEKYAGMPFSKITSSCACARFEVQCFILRKCVLQYTAYRRQTTYRTHYAQMSQATIFEKISQL